MKTAVPGEERKCSGIQQPETCGSRLFCFLGWQTLAFVIRAAVSACTLGHCYVVTGTEDFSRSCFKKKKRLLHSKAAEENEL